jgi:hypothetical protein
MLSAPALPHRAVLRLAPSDEAWVALGALDDDAWYAGIEADFGMDARPQVRL